MDIKPIRDMLFCKILRVVEEKKIGSIILPNQEVKGCKVAKVIAVGDGKMFPDQKKSMTFNVKIGDVVIVNVYAGTTLTEATGEYLLVSYNEITGVWNDFEKEE